MVFRPHIHAAPGLGLDASGSFCMGLADAVPGSAACLAGACRAYCVEQSAASGVEAWGGILGGCGLGNDALRAAVFRRAGGSPEWCSMGWSCQHAGFCLGWRVVADCGTAGMALAEWLCQPFSSRVGYTCGRTDAGYRVAVGFVDGPDLHAIAVVPLRAAIGRLPWVAAEEVSAKPPGRQPEPGVQVGESNLALGSSDARRSRLLGNVSSPCSMSIGSRQYKARGLQTISILRGSVVWCRQVHIRTGV